MLKFSVIRRLAVRSTGIALATVTTLAVTASLASAQVRWPKRVDQSPFVEKAVAKDSGIDKDNGPASKASSVKTSFQFPVGSIVIVNDERRLYYVTAPGEARRYKVAVGKTEELWMGRTFIAAKAVDPKWIPVNGDDPVEGGDAANPLGKRAMYIDWSLLRIHGTPSRGSIGSAVSNGCIRMLNEDVIDLFDRVHLGAAVYAIKSWKDATLYADVKVGEKIYVDPEARRIAKEEEAERLAEQADERGERDKAERATAARAKADRAKADRDERPRNRRMASRDEDDDEYREAVARVRSSYGRNR